MTLAQVQMAVAVATLIVLSWMALTLATALAFPVHALRASETLEAKPKRSFGIGALMAVLFVILLNLIAVPNPLIKLIAFLGSLGIGAMLCIGAAGLAKLFGQRIGDMAGARTSFGELVRGSLVFSVAMAFPYFGWFLFAPVTVFCALGAGAMSVLRKASPVSASLSVSPSEG